MSVVLDNREYDLIPNPGYGKYQPKRKSPKIRFQADAGYVHQRDQFPSATRPIEIEMELMSDAERNMLMAWIDYKKSGTFWYVLPESLKPRPDGRIIPTGILCRIVDDEITDEPEHCGYWKAKITLESIGAPVTPAQHLVTGILTQAEMRLALLTDGYAGIYLPESLDVKPYRVDRVSVWDSALKMVRGYAMAKNHKAVNLVSSTSAGGLSIADDANLNNGVNDFAFLVEVSCPDWSEYTLFAAKFQDADNYVAFDVSDNKLRYRHAKTAGTSVSAQLTNALSLTNGKSYTFMFVITRERASAAGSVAIYLDYELVETILIPAGTPADISNTGAWTILGYGTRQYAGIVKSAYLINYAPTSSQITSIGTDGIATADQWGQNAVASGSVTLTDLCLSLVDGYASVDFSAADVLTDYIVQQNPHKSYRLVVLDSALKKIIGYIKAVSPTIVASTASTASTVYAAWANKGIWKYTTGGWQLVHGTTPVAMCASASLLFATFAGDGLYKYDGTTWTKLNTDTPTVMAAYGDWLIYSTDHPYKYNLLTDTITQIAVTPMVMVSIADADILYVKFSTPNTLYRYVISTGTWTSLSGSKVIHLCAAAGDCYATFDGYNKTYLYTGSWAEVHATKVASAGAFVSTDFYAVFDDGIWKHNGGTSWTQISSDVPDMLTGTATKLYAHFASTKLMKSWDGANWATVLSASTSGVTITSTPDGSIYNWESIESGFNCDDAAGYTYQIDKLGVTAAHDESGIRYTGWRDSSTNNLNISYPASGYAVVRHYDIASAPGGETQNWQMKETGFDEDDENGYTYEIEYYE